MKRFIAAALLLIGIGSIITASSSQLLKNGDFSGVTYGNALPEGWQGVDLSPVDHVYCNSAGECQFRFIHRLTPASLSQSIDTIIHGGTVLRLEARVGYKNLLPGSYISVIGTWQGSPVFNRQVNLAPGFGSGVILKDRFMVLSQVDQIVVTLYAGASGDQSKIVVYSVSLTDTGTGLFYRLPVTG